MIDIALITSLLLNATEFKSLNTTTEISKQLTETISFVKPKVDRTPIITEIRQFRFELARCITTQNPESPYRCDFLVENIGRDTVPISINGDVAPQRTSYLVDTQGRRIAATMVDAAGDRQTFYGTAQAPPNVPLRVSVFFEAVPDGQVSFIELFCTAPRNPGQRFSATFRIE